MRQSLRYTTGLALALMLGGVSHAGVWQDAQADRAAIKETQAMQSQVPYLKRARQLKLNAPQMAHELGEAPKAGAGVSAATIELPLPHGGFATFALVNAPIMEPALAAKNPSIQTFKAVDVSNPNNRGRLDMTPAGFHAMFSYGSETVFIDPLGKDGSYQSYYKADFANERQFHNHSPIVCTAEEHNARKAETQDGRSNKSSEQTRFLKDDVSFGTNLRTYRIAIAATGEFTAFHGGTKELGLAAIVTGLNRVNEVFNADLAVELELVSNNIDIVYTDAATDPYTDDDPEALIEETENDLNTNIGLNNYDIGHVFSTGGGGLAGFGVVCGAFKHEGVTGSTQPINDPFFIDFVAHEFGHQFRANHSFNGTAGACQGNRVGTAAYEPGGGTTIMGYAGICADENIQNQGDVYFHTNSIAEMREYIDNASLGGSCGISTALGNSAPTADAGADQAIPISTPFELTGSATDADAGDTLTYVWEQYDLGPSTRDRAGLTDMNGRPLFRSFTPTASPSRTFPQISDIISGTTTYGEVLPTATRDREFRFTVRDGKGGVTSDTMTLAVNANAGPFTVTSPASASWTGNSAQTVTWDVANTTAAPISCENVEISLSTDAGQSFATTVLASTPNDGTQSITVPNVDTTTGRLRVACDSQPFFAVNSANLSITSSTAPPPSNTNPVANPDTYSVRQDIVTTIDSVLTNDTDAEGDTLTLTGVSNFSDGGSAQISGTRVIYTPAAGFSGTETFDYSISDGNGGTATATVTLEVAPTPPANSAPTATDDSFTFDQDSAATNLAVLSNDTDPDGDTLSITGVSAPSGGGTASISGTNISYQPAAGFSGNESFTYDISDGNDGTSTATVSISVTAAPPPTPTPAPTPPSSSGGGGGGSVGLFLLMLLGLGGLVKNARMGRAVTSAKE